MAIELDATRRVTPLVQSPFTEQNGTVSPDGRWLAYEANDSGRFEIYVRPFPEVNSGRSLVSTTGGTRPIWARSGQDQELFNVAPTGALMRVAVARGRSRAATTPTLGCEGGVLTNVNWWGRSYDVSPDGQRFLMIKEGGIDGTVASPSIIVVQHWVDELKRLVPAKSRGAHRSERPVSDPARSDGAVVSSGARLQAAPSARRGPRSIASGRADGRVHSAARAGLEEP